MSGKPGRRAKPHEEEEHENHERWLVSYADMVTLLMVLFIVLFAISQVDKEKYDQLATGLAESFGAPITSMGQGASAQPSVFDGYPQPVEVPTEILPVQQSAADAQDAQAAAAAQDLIEQQAQEAYEQLAAIRDRLQADLARAGFPDAAQFEIDERGLVAHLVADGLLFSAESAVLRPEGKAIIEAVGPTMQAIPNQLRVEGHANSVPVTPGGPWLSNWELSAARSSVIVRYIISADGIAGDRLAAIGFSDTRPLVPDSDPAALTVNRRVDIVVVSTAPAAANALLPAIDATASPQGATP